MELFKITWWIFIVCIVGIIFLNFQLIPRLKRLDRNEFEKAGKPSPFWSDLRSFKFMLYILNRSYESLPDENLISLFKLARLFWIIALISMALFFISISGK